MIQFFKSSAFFYKVTPIEDSKEHFIVEWVKTIDSPLFYINIDIHPCLVNKLVEAKQSEFEVAKAAALDALGLYVLPIQKSCKVPQTAL